MIVKKTRIPGVHLGIRSHHFPRTPQFPPLKLKRHQNLPGTPQFHPLKLKGHRNQEIMSTAQSENPPPTDDVCKLMMPFITTCNTIAKYLNASSNNFASSQKVAANLIAS